MSVAQEVGLSRRSVVVAAGARLSGELLAPPYARGVVVAACAGRANRTNATTSWVAEQLCRRGDLAVLLVDLLTSAEDPASEAAQLRAQVPLLAQRLSAATEWALADDSTRHLSVGYYAIGLGAAPALVAASGRREVRAVVCRGGRPDLAGAALEAVRAPTLLVVGETDEVALATTRSARSRLGGKSELAIVSACGESFDSPDARGELAARSSEWLSRYVV